MSDDTTDETALERVYWLTRQLELGTQTVEVLGAIHDRLTEVLRLPAWQQGAALRALVADLYDDLQDETAALQATMAEFQALEQDQAAAEVLGHWRAFLERADTGAPMTPASSACVPPVLEQCGAAWRGSRKAAPLGCGLSPSSRAQNEALALRPLLTGWVTGRVSLVTTWDMPALSQHTGLGKRHNMVLCKSRVAWFCGVATRAGLVGKGRGSQSECQQQGHKQADEGLLHGGSSFRFMGGSRVSE